VVSSIRRKRMMELSLFVSLKKSFVFKVIFLILFFISSFSCSASSVF